MIELLNEVGKKITDRWFATLVLPGLLYTAIAVAGYVLGHGHPFDRSTLTQALADIDRRSVPLIVTAVLTLLVASGVSFVAQALGGVVRRVLTGRRPQAVVAWRRCHPVWWRPGLTRPVTDDPYLPARMSPAGDELRLLGHRVAIWYGIDIGVVWPRLWLLLPEPTRATIQTANARYLQATTGCAWALLYLALGIRWWPAAIGGAVALVVSHHRARAAAATLASLIESVVDIHQKTLADALNVPLPHGRITPTEGAQLNDLCNKNRSVPTAG
jgi:hypothetical protein